MKRIIVLFFSLFIVAGFSDLAFSQAQSKKENIEKVELATKLEQFSSKKGRLYVKDIFHAGTVGEYDSKIEVKAIIMYEPGKETEKVRGLKIEVYDGGRSEKKRSSFLDIDEAESLSKAIEYMINLIDKLKDTNREYTEVLFSSKEDFTLGFYQKGNFFKAFASIGSIGRIGEVSYFMPGEVSDPVRTSLSGFKATIDKGIDMAKKP